MEEAVLVLKEGKRTDHQHGRSTKLFQRALQRDTSSPDEVTTLPLYPSLPAQLLAALTLLAHTCLSIIISPNEGLPWWLRW